MNVNGMLFLVALTIMICSLPVVPSCAAAYPTDGHGSVAGPFGENLGMQDENRTIPEIIPPFEKVSVNRTVSGVEIVFPDIVKPGEGDDILRWPVFSKAFLAVFQSGESLMVTLRQNQRVGDWKISKSVVFNSAEEFLMTSYEFISGQSLVAARREEVEGVDRKVLKLMASGDFRSVNAMNLRSRVYSGHLPPVPGAWLLRP